MKRTFIAFDIIPAVVTRTAFEHIRQTLKGERISWVDVAQFHLTLKFLGDTDEQQIPGISEALNKALTDHHPFIVSIAGFGVFSSLRDPRVIWLGCRFDKRLEEIKKIIDDTLIPFGFEPENRKFSPHFTVGRIKFIKNVRPLAELIKQYEDDIFQQEQVNKIIFYESQLKPTGPVYKPIGVFKLS